MSIARLVLLLVALTTTVFARQWAERSSTEIPLSVQRSVRMPAEWSRIAALGFDSVVADALWIRFLQRLPMRPAGPELGAALAADLHTVIALDPDFRDAYYHGSVLLSVLGDEPCDSLEIAAQGAKRFPTDWRLPFQAGYTCFIELSDNECAARHMQAAASLEGAPRWLPALVARLLSGSGNAEAAIVYLQHQLASTNDPRLKERFTERLRDAVLTRDLRVLNEARRRHLSQTGEPPTSLEALVTAGLLTSIPVEPFGGRYELTPEGIRSTSGRGEMAPENLESHADSRFLEIRVLGRLGDLARTHDEHSPRIARMLALAADPERALRAMELLVEIEEGLGGDRRRIANLRALQARTIILLDLRRLARAQLDWLRRNGTAPSLEDLHASSGVPRRDPLGSPYRLEKGVPESEPGHTPIHLIESWRSTRVAESSRCGGR